jgi:hypothetical protein
MNSVDDFVECLMDFTKQTVSGQESGQYKVYNNNSLQIHKLITHCLNS